MPYIKQPPHHHKPNKDSKEPNHEFCKRCGLILHRGRWQKNEALVKEQKKKWPLPGLPKRKRGDSGRSFDH